MKQTILLKKVATMMLALSFLATTAAVTFAEGTPEKTGKTQDNQSVAVPASTAAATFAEGTPEKTPYTAAASVMPGCGVFGYCSPEGKHCTIGNKPGRCDGSCQCEPLIPIPKPK